MVTLAEVAQHAGVSASTVSYVLSGKRSISTTTRQRVEESIRTLGYHPNAGARALASSRSNIIALMIPLRTDMYVPVMMEIAIAVATTARAHGYDVLLLTGEEGPDAVRRVTGSGLADAMIVMDVELRDERLPLLRGTDRPSVLIGLPADTSGLTCVDLDFRATGALCVEHLASLGHRDIAVIGEAPGVYERHTGFAERTLQGLRGRALELGLRLLHRPCEGGYDAMALTLSRIFDERPGTSGFVVQNEAAVEPLLALLRQQGRAVPEDVSVVAVCPEQVATQASVRLTSVAVPAQEMGRHAVEQLVAKLGGRGSDEVVLLPPELTVRASSGPAPGWAGP
ncbi:LacI family DNA-binding transcriptional regulator [Streptomyces griseoviridis]|jgi:DNA-binding LacI/PurR family transcriptional regulator|uniref:DNA-binding LacI/PurR family transcriptional regulator n=3 Tax=Streptomyces TaxID=1883 RepID=A0ABT9LLG7_STRGD|nr:MULTISPECIES: LacI family DNA-binding transcriptional regulator [Streptomyces]MDP9684386.1 DNA-binding LacI/PurR family transcriptional regulator [Streptomyces griseoviridis]GGS61651.1 LacI family transcriptional regulator [Streptomyces niveoruber]GGT00986.1 LacI family transcriptional regulator [Streptomyces griseoviridis]GGU38270.1 LacI family transcriptional regulator [Streptomyces daghestanicus]GHI30653.1 LacI family transcriptional regulator [Streptomyces daghestanicus]